MRLNRFSIMLMGASMIGMYASGFRLPEQSLNGTALNSAYVAGAMGADSTYYNPANMGFGKDSDKYEFEFNLMGIFIPGFTFDTENRDKGNTASVGGASGCAVAGACPAVVEGRANTTFQPVPKFFFKSRAYNPGAGFKVNYGFSFTTPSGLSMDWDGDGGGFLDDVSIAMLELNPVISISWRDMIAFAAGFRAIYASGSFNNTLFVPYDANVRVIINVRSVGTTKVEQTSSAQDWGFGYNLALSVRPFSILNINMLKNTTFSLTYRSKVSWTMNGTLSALSHIDGGRLAGTGTVNMDADLTLFADLPTQLSLAISQDFYNFRAEFVWERTFYGSARIFDFAYSNQNFHSLQGSALLQSLGLSFITSLMDSADYSAVAYGNGWRDADAFRFGLTYFGKSYTLMGSAGFDGTPAPQGSFGIPDANAYIFGFGATKTFLNGKLSVGASYACQLKDNRKSFIVSRDGFGQLHLFTVGAKVLW